jgi:hypothetical protein
VLLLAWPAIASAQDWGPPPPDVPTRDPNEEPPPPPPEVEPQPEPEPTIAEPPSADPNDEAETGDDEAEEEGEEAEEGEENRFRRFLSRIGVQFHGYSRVPLNLHFRPRDETGGEEGEEAGSYLEVRSPLLRDNNYYSSGFEYTRLVETDWTEMFLGVGSEDVQVTVGFFASLFSDWAHIDQGSQWGLAQAALDWRNIGGIPLSLKAGVFWERLGYIQPYDTYMFGRTHWMGLRLGYEFSNGANIRMGFGASKEWYERNVGMTPLFYIYGGTPIGPITLNGYILYSFMNDVPPDQAANWQRGNLFIGGIDFQFDFDYRNFRGPLYLAFAGYRAEHAIYMSGVTEILHSWSGRGLTENYFGLQSQDGTGSIFAASLDFPMEIWRGIGLRLFGMLAYVRSEQVSEDPLVNRDSVWKLKWGIEPSYQILDWLRVSLQYQRVIPVMNQTIEGIEDAGLPTLSWRALSPEVRFTPYRDIHIRLQYIHYFYGEDVRLRPGTALMIENPDEDVFRLVAEATW